jgi:hypothetical protein
LARRGQLTGLIVEGGGICFLGCPRQPVLERWNAFSEFHCHKKMFWNDLLCSIRTYSGKAENNPINHAKDGRPHWVSASQTVFPPYSMCICTYVHFYICTYVPMYICTYAHLYLCTFVPMHICTYVHLFLCTSVPMYNCTYVQLYLCTIVPMYNCTYVQLYLCTSVPMYICTYVYTHLYLYICTTYICM